MSALLKPVYQERRLGRRLINWGLWLNYDRHIGPDHARCVSIESRYREDSLGDVMDDQPPPREIPDVQDAESLQKLISKLASIEQYALAVEYGGMPCVMRWRRVSEANLKKAGENAYILLRGML